MTSSTSRRKRYALPALTFLLGIGFSLAVYWLLLAPNKSNQLQEAITEIPSKYDTSKTHDQHASAQALGPDQSSSATPTSLSDIEQINSPFDRSLALRDLLANTDEEGAFDLLTQSLSLPSHPRSRELQTAIIQRLAQINPSRALTHATKLDKREPFLPAQFVPNVYKEWAQSNLNEAITSAKSLEESTRRSASEAILQERIDLPEEKLREIARDLGDEQIAVALIRQLEVNKAIENPARNWSGLVSSLQDDVQHSWNISRVAISWIEESGFGVMDQIVSSLTNSQTKLQVVRNVLNSVAETDPSTAFEYALTIEDDLYNMTLTGVADTWARSDPRAALAAASQVDQSTLRNQLQDSIIRTWAHAEPRGILKSAGELPERLSALATQAAIWSIAWTSPREAAELVSELEAGPEKTQIATDVAFTWARGDARAALDWIQTEPSISDIQPQLLESIIGRLAPVDPALAMEIALGQSIADGGTGMELRVVSALAMEDVEKALELLPQTRKGQTRLRAYQNVGRALARNNNIDQALELLQQVPDPEKSSVFLPIAAAWARTDSEGLLDSIDRLSSQELKSKAAMAIVLSNREWQKVLSDERIEEARKFLEEGDRQLLEEGEASTFQWW